VLERRYEGMASREDDPERLYARQWAVTVVERARERLRLAYVAAGKSREFEVLAPYLVGGPGANAAPVAPALGISEGAARVALHRLRRRFGAELRAEVAGTVDGPEQVEEELHFLLTALADRAT
jgi:hypothetical protein